MANAVRKRSLLTKVQVNDASLSEESDIMDGVSRASHSLFFSQQGDYRASIGGSSFEVLGSYNSKSLEELLSRKVFNALSHLCEDKALGQIVSLHHFNSCVRISLSLRSWVFLRSSSLKALSKEVKL